MTKLEKIAVVVLLLGAVAAVPLCFAPVEAQPIPHCTPGQSCRVLSLATTKKTGAGVSLAGDAGILFGDGTILNTGTGGGVTTVGTFSATSVANGASISGSTVTFGPSDGTNPGMISESAQTMGAGNKTFSGIIISSNASGNHASEIVQGAKSCLNGSTCTSYAGADSSDGHEILVTTGNGQLQSGQNAQWQAYYAFQIGQQRSNQITIDGNSNGNPITMVASGNDSNIDISITPKGSGVVNATGLHATASTSVGTITLAASTTGTATVRSGCKPICTNTTNPTAVQCTVATTTLTATETLSSSDAINYFCF